MTFTVTYRAKDGALREERIEAASRAECVAECRKRGIAPTGIAEGKPGISGKLWLAIGAALVIVAGGVWWWFGGRGATEPAEAPAKPKVEKPKAAKPKTASVQQQGSEKIGLQPRIRVTYEQTCREGWAPAPTNDVVEVDGHLRASAPRRPAVLPGRPWPGRVAPRPHDTCPHVQARPHSGWLARSGWRASTPANSQRASPPAALPTVPPAK